MVRWMRKNTSSGKFSFLVTEVLEFMKDLADIK